MRALCVLLLTIFLAGAVNAEAETSLETEKDRASYSIGLDIGLNFKKQTIDIDAEKFYRGFKDGFEGKEPLMTVDEVKDALSNLQKAMMEKQAAKAREIGDMNTKAGTEFLEKNAAKEGVTTLPSGLQYKVITEGKGGTPKETDTVSVHYRGTLINGTEFDSSYKRNQPATFNVGGVIKGWVEALQLMKEGSKWMLYIPSDLAYGERGAGRSIGPNETLIFEVELLSILKDK